LGGAEAETALLARITDERIDVAWAAIDALAACASDQATVKKLSELARQTGNPRTKKACEDAASAITARTAGR